MGKLRRTGLTAGLALALLGGLAAPAQASYVVHQGYETYAACLHAQRTSDSSWSKIVEPCQYVRGTRGSVSYWLLIVRYRG
ncbi:hypothetical protein ICW40_09545 [Actinotalea ferrariae]|uniref:hypothetical protein n=1 Tax=Actinotalea ferrariae TaxID=1386098 RepID=UPI001C8CEE2C|nr:hypothetical protein [Actinotalea ferrariae]MBX9245049.1 hypothetical protein [Actinotalea ferrariae]